MKRASYREATRWIALNDSPGDSDDDVESLITVLLVADIFGVSTERVARDVLRVRRKMGAA